MSLINEALKKAQRLRNEDAGDPSATPQAGGAPIMRRGKADSTNTMVLIGSGALVLVVLSVVATVFLVNRPVKPAAVAVGTPAVQVKATTPSAATEPSTPAIVAPTITLPASTTTTTDAIAVGPTPILVASTVTPAPQASASDAVNPAPLPAEAKLTPPVATAPVAQTPAPPLPLAPDAPDERISAFVEAIRVTGIRSSGAESRVLMNERVYRVNDIVERTLNVRLIKAAADNLTFSDSRGVTYVKRF